MENHKRQMLHVATAIHEQLAHFRSTPPDVTLPHSDWSYCVDILRRMRLAQERGWQHAAKRQQQCLAEQLTFFKDRLASLADTLAKPPRVPILASVAEIYRDIGSLSLEFDEVNWDLRDKTLSVHTEPITLGDVYLGPFEIQVDIRKMSDHGCYRIIAHDPRPAASNSSVTHPHVQDEQLCEGEGKSPIRRALREGRIADFLLIVANLLSTYNSSSPFVALDDWDGTRCADCGTLTTEDDRCGCDRCGGDICLDCSRSCGDCGSYFCADCLSECSDCRDAYCTQCLKRCRECNEPFCKHCLENQLCGNCRQQQEDDEDEYDEAMEETPATDDAEQTSAVLALQPNGLGEAVVSARLRRHGSGWFWHLRRRRFADGQRRATGQTGLHAGHRGLRGRVGGRLL